MSFDRLARHYDWMERVLAGEKLQGCRVRWLAEVSGARNILLVGEGHGRFLVECARALPKAEITCVDASAGMLAVARGKVTEEARIRFVQATLPAAIGGGPFDLVVTNFFLDCFGEGQLREVIGSLSSQMTAEAGWLISEFHEPRAGLRRWRAKAVLALAYAFFGVATGIGARRIPKYGPMLEGSGFGLERRALFDWDLIAAELWRRNSRGAISPSAVRQE